MNPMTDIPIVEELLRAKQWSCIFLHEEQMRLGTSDAPFRAAALLKECVEALEAISAGKFNCMPRQYFMAAQGVADTALAAMTKGEA